MITIESINNRLGYDFEKRLDKEEQESSKRAKLGIIDDGAFYRSKIHDLTEEEKEFYEEYLMKTLYSK